MIPKFVIYSSLIFLFYLITPGSGFLRLGKIPILGEALEETLNKASEEDDDGAPLKELEPAFFMLMKPTKKKLTELESPIGGLLEGLKGLEEDGIGGLGRPLAPFAA